MAPGDLPQQQAVFSATSSCRPRRYPARPGHRRRSQRGGRQPVPAAADLVADSAGGTRVTGHIDLGPDHHPVGVVHAVSTPPSVESAASFGASLAVRDRAQFAVGVHNATDFLRPATSGRAEVIAEPLQQCLVQQLWLVTITDERCKALARGQIRLQNVPLPGTGTEADERPPGSSELTGTMSCPVGAAVPATSLQNPLLQPKRCTGRYPKQPCAGGGRRDRNEGAAQGGTCRRAGLGRAAC